MKRFLRLSSPMQTRNTSSTMVSPMAMLVSPLLTALLLIPLLLIPKAAFAGPLPIEPPATGLATPLSGFAGGQAPWTIVVLLTLLTLIPALLLSMTPFVRLLIVFHFLRQALGTQSTPTNQTLIGLALVLTFFLMQPVGVAIQQQAIVPLEAGRITPMAAVELGRPPASRPSCSTTFARRTLRSSSNSPNSRAPEHRKISRCVSSFPPTSSPS